VAEIHEYVAGTPCWVDVSSADLAVTRSFYGGLFGWEAEEDPRPEAGGYGMFRLRGHDVSGFGPLPGGRSPAWSTYVASDDVDRTARAIEGAGGKVVARPMDVLDAGRMLAAADPAGAVFGVWQAGAHRGAGLANEPGSFTWNELTTPDVEAAQAFYTAVFGWEREELEARGEQEPFAYHVQRLGRNMVAGIMEMDPSWGNVPAHWMTYFAVADVDEAAERVEELGGTVCVEPFDAAYGRVAVIDDPVGATCSLVELGAEQA
jgi:predicted enzyme related to lactoylglutathione lyase